MRDHPFESEEVFDDFIPDNMTEAQVLAELEPYPITAAAIAALRAGRAA